MQSLLKVKAWLISLMTIAVLVSCQQSLTEPCALLIEKEEAATHQALEAEESKGIVPTEAIPRPIAREETTYVTLGRRRFCWVACSLEKFEKSL